MMRLVSGETPRSLPGSSALQSAAVARRRDPTHSAGPATVAQIKTAQDKTQYCGAVCLFNSAPSAIIDGSILVASHT